MRYIIFLWMILWCNSIFPVLGMELHPAEDSRPLGQLISCLDFASKAGDKDEVITCWKDFNGLEDLNWEEEAHALGVLPWGMDNDYKSQVGAHLFWEAAINPPHQNLLRQALDPLKHASGDEWQSIYNDCKARVFEVLKNHCYLRRPSRAYAMGMSAHFGNPIARLFTLEFLHLLNENDAKDPQKEKALKKMHQPLCFNLRDIVAMKSSLDEFLSLGTENFKDLPETEFNNLHALEEKSALGLPRYDLLLGNYYFRLYTRTEKNPDFTTLANLQKAEQYCTNALMAGDPIAALSLCHSKASRGEYGIEELYEAQKDAFLDGYFERYRYLSGADRELLESFMDKLYTNIMSFIKKPKDKARR